MQFTADKGENPDSVRILRTRVSIEETIEFLAMAMQVQDEPYFSLLADFLDKCLDAAHLWTIEIFLCSIPLSVQIFA